jgi:hypothetical protein
MAEAKSGDYVAAADPARPSKTNNVEIASIYLDLAAVWRKDESTQKDKVRAVDRQLAEGIARTNSILISFVTIVIVAGIGFVWTS